MGGHGLDVVLAEEPCDAGVMRALGPGVVEAVPADVELLPVVDSVLADGRDGDPLCPTPTRAERTFDGDGNADDDLGTPWDQ